MPTVAVIPTRAPWVRRALIASAILCVVGGAPGGTEAQIIESTETGVANGETTVRLTFRTRLGYLSHLRTRRGRELQIRLRRLKPSGIEGEARDGTGRPAGRSTPGSLLEEIRVGEIPSGPMLFLRFSKPSRYSVRSSSDGLSLVVVARRIGSKVSKTVRPPAPKRKPSAVSVPAPRSRPVVKARRATPSQGYQVQLSASDSRAVAERIWRKLLKAEPTLLGGIGHEMADVPPALRRPGVRYTLRTTAFDDQGAATRLCDALKKRGHDCFVVRAPSRSSVATARKATPKESPGAESKSAFAIDLAWSRRPFEPAALPDIQAFRDHRLYTRRARQNRQSGYRLRLGFFATRKQALRILPKVRDRYADARIVKVDFNERRRSARTKITLPGKPTTSVAKRRGKLPPIAADRLEAIVGQARSAMTARNYDRAVQLYTKLLRYPEHAHSREAQELLGLARERKGQVAHAKAEYETYLRVYPDGEGADRVRQRLAAVLTSRARPKKKLRTAKRRTQDGSWETQLYGGLSQAYSRQERFTDFEGRVTDRSDLFTDADLTARAFDDNSEVKFQFVGGHAFNFLDETDANESRISNLYFDGLHRSSGLSTRLGRQSQSSGGVLGRFDGGKVGYRLMPDVALNLVGGFPIVSTTSTVINYDKRFLGANVDLGRYADHWDFNLFAIEQHSDGILDRRAVGGEARFVDIETGSVFSLLDYDVSYSVLNIALMTGNFSLPDKTMLNVVLDYRRSPIQTTTTGLQGLQVGDLSDALVSFSEDALRSFAEDRTAISRSATLGAARPLDERFQVSGDVTVSHLTDTTASGGIEATPGTGYEFLYTAQFIGTGLVKESDTSILGLSYSDRDGSDTVSGSLNIRYPISREWRINPRLRGDYRWEDLDSTQNRIRFKPSLKTDYRLRRWLRLEAEIGAEWSTQRFVDDTEESTDFFMTLGYRVDY